MNIRPLIIFDIDGTLVLYEKGFDFFDAILVETLKRMGIDPPPYSERIELWKMGPEHYEFMMSWGIKDYDEFWDIFDELDFNERKEGVEEGRIHVRSDAYGVLEKLYNEGYRIAALTNSTNAIAGFLLDKFNLRQFFEYIMGLADEKDPYLYKPEPKGLIRLLNELGYSDKRDKAVMVGDSFSDVMAAVRSGVHPVLISDEKMVEIPAKYSDELEYSNFTVIGNLTELPSYLEVYFRKVNRENL